MKRKALPLLGYLVTLFLSLAPRPWTSDFRKWRREWGTEKIILPLKRQLTFIRSANWYKANGRAGTKGPSNVSLRTRETRERSDVVVGKIGMVPTALLWYGKRPLANSLNGQEQFMQKLANTLYFPAINGSYKIHIFIWRSSGTNIKRFRIQSLLYIACNKYE